MRRNGWIALICAATVACSSSDGTPVPAAVRALQDYIGEQADSTFDGLRQFLAALAVIAEGGGEGITFEPSDDPMAPDDAYDFSIPIDTDGNGSLDATIDGTVVLSGDPEEPIGNGFSAEATFSIAIDNTKGAGTISGTISAILTAAGLEVWGSGGFTDFTEGITGTFLIEETDPVVIRQAVPEGEGNVCEADVAGPVNVTMGPTAVAPAIDVFPAGHLKALFEFFFGSSTVDVRDAVYNDPDAGEVSIPDTTTELPPCGASIDDWVGSFILEWNCDGFSETGTSRVEFTKINETTLMGRDSDPDNASDFFTFEATVDPNNPHRITGFFIDTDGGGTYREDFVMTLTPDGNSWTQDNTYTYISGGSGSGTCGGTGTREVP